MRHFLMIPVMAALFLTACQTSTGTGVLVGAALGAGTGGLIGGGQGALIGGAVGMAGGGLVGAALDNRDRKVLEKKSPQTLDRLDRGERLSTDDIKRMSKAGISDQVIIDQIKRTESRFMLSADDIIALKNAGVSNRVIDYMIQTE